MRLVYTTVGNAPGPPYHQQLVATPMPDPQRPKRRRLAPRLLVVFLSGDERQPRVGERIRRRSPSAPLVREFQPMSDRELARTSKNLPTHSQASTGELTQYFPLDGSNTRGIYVSVFRPYIRSNGASSGPRADGIEQFQV